MSGMYMSEWPMFGTKDPNLGSSTDLLFDRDFIFGAFATCLIQGGYPVGETFERTGDVVTTGGTFGPNEVVTLNGKMYHHGQITDTIPSYDVSPFIRPTAPDVYDTAASQPNPDKHGLNWEFSDPKNGWAWDLLDGRADGVDAYLNFDFTDGWVTISTSSITPNTFTGAGSSGLYKDGSLTIGDRYLIRVSGNSTANNFRLFQRDTALGLDGSLIYQEPTGNFDSNDIRITATRESLYLNMDGGGTSTLVTLSATELSPATGTLNLKGFSVVPSVTEWQTTGDFNILSGATGNQILYIEPGTGLICATDGTNTCKSIQPYVAGTDHLVSLVFGDGNMQIIMDGTKGGLAPFVGTFTPGETLKWGLNNEDIFSKGNVCGSTTATFGEAVELAQDLAFTL